MNDGTVRGPVIFLKKINPLLSIAIEKNALNALA